MDKLYKYKLKKCKNPEISLWKEEERKMRKKTGKATKLQYICKKTILSFN